MLDELIYAKKMLKLGQYTLFLCSEGRVFFSEGRGICPLLELVGTEEWKGACAADKIVGKAAAMLYVLLGVRAVYAEVMSEEAKNILEQYDILCQYDTLTENIINRKGTGLCPMELAVKDVEKPSDAPSAIREKIKTLAKA